jgi:hypothetical protein
MSGIIFGSGITLGAGIGVSDGGLWGSGAIGAVRIIWGPGRGFPSTNTGDV